MELYEKLSQVGEGTYGKVYKARLASNQGELVALKTIRMEAEKEGFPITAVREIKLLKLLDHANIIKIKDIVASKDGVSLVFHYYDHDLSGLMMEGLLDDGHKKYILMKILEALKYLHDRQIVHRDIKTSNVLIGSAGEVILADFGLAKSLLHPDLPAEEHRLMTNRMMTLWYRPLELLLGSTRYGTEVDMWGVGCVMYELFAGRPLFAESTELAQIQAILARFPYDASLESYPWSTHVDLRSLSSDSQVKSIDDLLAECMPLEAQKLASKLLSLDPRRRPTARDALRDPYFREGPKPNPGIPGIDGGMHEFEAKQNLKSKKQ